MEKISNFFWKLVWGLTFLISSTILLNAVFIPGNVNGTSSYYNQIYIFFSAVVLGITLLIFLKQMEKSRLFRNVLLSVTTIALICFELYLAIKMQGAQGVDDFDVRLQIAKLLTGSRVWSGYFDFAPNIITTIVMAGVVKLFGGATHIGIITNLFQFIMIDISIVLGYRMAKRYLGTRYSNLFLLLCELFSPLWLTALILYTDPLAASLGIIGIYLGCRSFDVENFVGRLVQSALAVFFITFASAAKMNLVILFIAWILIVAFNRQDKLIGKLAILLVSVCIFVVATMSFTSIKKNMNAPTEGSFPYSYWVAVGYNSDTDGTVWKNGIDTWSDTNRYKTKQDKDEYDKRLVTNSIKENGVLGLLSLYQRKINGQWSVGTLGVESRFYQIQKRSSYISEYIYGPRRILLFTLVQITYIWILLGMCLASFLLFAKTNVVKKNVTLNFMAIYFLGIFLFHTFLWEVQPRYGYIVIIPMIYMATVGINKLSDEVVTNKFMRNNVNSLSIILIVGLFVGFVQGIKIFTSPINDSRIVMGQDFFRRDTLKIAPKQKITEKVKIVNYFNEWKLSDIDKNPKLSVEIDGEKFGSHKKTTIGVHNISIENISKKPQYLQLVKSDKMDLLQEPINGYSNYYLPVQAIENRYVQPIKGWMYGISFVLLLVCVWYNRYYLSKFTQQ
ncbi:glycosyltransferase family protein [Ligilactobacillus agilis]|uniref:hypothetical protein n=1 Tax=Ligilactobacillus agilis TaxID=1601 RepID=UPI00067EC74B|nr:hypothetical protein [Ligilactobacillus agilis]